MRQHLTQSAGLAFTQDVVQFFFACTTFFCFTVFTGGCFGSVHYIFFNTKLPCNTNDAIFVFVQRLVQRVHTLTAKQCVGTVVRQFVRNGLLQIKQAVVVVANNNYCAVRQHAALDLASVYIQPVTRHGFYKLARCVQQVFGVNKLDALW